MESPNGSKLVQVVREAIDAAALAPEAWPAVLRLIAEGISGAQVGIQCFDTQGNRGIPLLFEGHWAEHIPAYQNHFGAINPWAPVMSTVPLLQPFSSADYMPAESFSETEFYRDWLVRIGDADGASAINLFNDSGRIAVLAVHYNARHSNAYVEAVEPLMRGLGGHLRRALHLNRLAFLADLRPDADLVDRLAEPALMLDVTGRLVAANALAARLLQPGGPFMLAPTGVVKPTETSHQPAFAAAVRSAGQGLGKSAGLQELRCGPTDTPYEAILLPACNSSRLSTPVTQAFHSSTSVLLVIRRRRDRRAGLRSCLVDEYGLTAAEIEVALALLRGESVQAIAASHRHSYETTRSQLKRIFAKTGTHRQAELVLFLQNL